MMVVGGDLAERRTTFKFAGVDRKEALVVLGLR